MIPSATQTTNHPNPGLTSRPGAPGSQAAIIAPHRDLPPSLTLASFRRLGKSHRRSKGFHLRYSPNNFEIAVSPAGSVIPPSHEARPCRVRVSRTRTTGTVRSDIVSKYFRRVGTARPSGSSSHSRPDTNHTLPQSRLH